MSYHKIFLLGFLGRDPELRYLGDGAPVCNMSVAISEKWTTDSGEQKERTIWWKVTARRRLAETCNQYLSKGSQVFVEGRMRADEKTGGPRIYTRNDGTPGSSFEITAMLVKFLGGRGDRREQDGGIAPEASIEEDAMPF
jgi:single-strand DNA-binding protein